MKKVLWYVAVLGLSTPSFAQLTMNNALTPTQLVNNVLLGSGVTASNITYTGASIARSSFSCGGACNLGVSTGVLLSSGQAVTSPGGGTGIFVSTDNGTLGDAQLNAIVTPRVTEDAAETITTRNLI